MIKLDKYDSHIVLLAKGHFNDNRTGERERILKILIGHRNMLRIEDVSDESIFYALLGIIKKLELRENLFRNLHKILFQDFFSRDTVLGRWIDFCMGEFSLLPIKDKDGTVLVELEPLDKSLIKPKGFIRLSDGEDFSLNENGTYSDDYLKKTYPERLYQEYTEELLIGLTDFAPYYL